MTETNNVPYNCRICWYHKDIPMPPEETPAVRTCPKCGSMAFYPVYYIPGK